MLTKHENAIKIQSTWRGFRCRTILERFKLLPSDIQQIIRCHLRREFTIQKTIQRIISRRIVRLKYSPCSLIHAYHFSRSDIRNALQTFDLVRKNNAILHHSTLISTCNIAARMVSGHSLNYLERLYINAVIEHLTTASWNTV